MIIPALDFIDGSVVRLHQGTMAVSATMMAMHWRGCWSISVRAQHSCTWST